ncbi:uncharacterized protein LOC123682340 [Harmonia axyridis]|uniref:uncharacterized protein LOC123682340 n=1 Tax=Harmonia axyridis TaxID=115357 RepID=UPI001E279C4F|nr:uncharacterized protein LOC123682340 [Harmonia axyridis]
MSMEIIRTQWLLHIMVVLCCSCEGSSLLCYSCSASIGYGSACEHAELFTTTISHHECFYKNPVCATYRIKYDNDIIIYRSCKKADVCLGLSKRYNTPQNQLLDCQTCNDNQLCNSAVERYLLPVSSRLILFVLISSSILTSVV